MPELSKHTDWSDIYYHFISRNIGIVSVEDQHKIKQSKIVIFGIGGLGGPIVEQLVRAGCEHVIICDNGQFEASNLNRQLCTLKDIGRYKVDVISELLRSINPNVEVTSIFNIEPELTAITKQVDLGVLTLDDLPLSIHIARAFRNKKRPLLESWGIPYLWGYWFSNSNPSYEQCYNFPTEQLTYDEIKSDKSLLATLREKLFSKLIQFPKIREKYDREPGTADKLLEGSLPFVSFGPIVRLTASYLAFEVIFTGILKIKKMILAPNIIGFDLYTMGGIQL